MNGNKPKFESWALFPLILLAILSGLTSFIEFFQWIAIIKNVDYITQQTLAELYFFEMLFSISVFLISLGLMALDQNQVKIGNSIIQLADSVESIKGEEKENKNIEIAQELKNKGDISFKNCEYSEAIECYAKALQLSPGNREIYNDLSLVYLATGDTHKAKECLKYAEK
jgi:tetratricopeptide (TPR) repeat protein